MPRPNIDLHLLETTKTGQLIEFLYDDGENDSVLVCAAHGGRIEPGTAEQAIELATRLDNASCWARLGHDAELEEFELWHPPSTAITGDDHPLLRQIADREFEVVISLHGLDEDGVIVGGRLSKETKARVKAYLENNLTVEVRTASQGQYSGTSQSNFVNWLAAGGGGLQIEQGPTTREADGFRVVSVVQSLIEEGVL